MRPFLTQPKRFHRLAILIATTAFLMLSSLSVQSACAQTITVWNGGGGDTDWFNGSNWDNGVPNGAFFAEINSGVTVDTGSGLSISIERLNLAVGNTLNIGNNFDFRVLPTANAGSGVVVNAGSINLTNSGSNTDWRVDGLVTVSGGGTITLGGTGNTSRILDETGGVDGIFHNMDNTIRGKGNIGFNRTQIINDGLIDANDSTGTLTLDPINIGDHFTNNGTLRASNGGELILDGFSGGKFFNAGGTIEALNGSTVRLTNVAAVVGGTLQSSGSGLFVVGPGDNAELEDVAFSGMLNVENNTDLELKGTINNTGAINVISGASSTDLQIEGSVTLTGGGTVTLDGGGNSRILDEVGGLTGILTNANNTIQGTGNIGFNRTQVINNGLIDANVNASSLTLDPVNGGDQFTNNGTLRASNGGELILDGFSGGKFFNAGGTIEALNGSTVRLTNVAAVVGGTMESVGTGRFVVGPIDNAELEDVSFSGLLDVENNTDLELKGTFNNSGLVTLNSTGSATDIQVEGDVFFTGGGTIRMGGVLSRITDETGGVEGIINNVDNLIEGNGRIGENRTVINNLIGGTFSANVNGETLQLNNVGTNIQNDGTYQAINGGLLLVVDNLTNNGNLFADVASTIDVDGDLTNSASGTLSGNGEIEADLILTDGTIAAGASVGHLTLDSNVDMGSTSLFDVEVDGSGADLLTVTGTLDLDGDLSISLLSGFLPSDTDTFTIAESSGLTGVFANVANGATLSTVGGEGTFVVNYGVGSAFDSNSVVLSNFQPSAIPEPSSALLLIIAGVGFASRIRRRRN